MLNFSRFILVIVVLFLVACTNAANNFSTGGGGAITLDNQIAVSISNVPNGSVCEDHLYAVIFEDFDMRLNPNQVQLEDLGNGLWGGLLSVASSATDQSIYYYCDFSRGDFAYDDDETAGPPNPVSYTNTAEFNACNRALGTQDQFSIYYGYYNYYYGPGTTFSSSTIYNDYFNTKRNNQATSGDSFALRIADEGDFIDVDFSQLVPLSDENHPDARGTLQQWCNCILGETHTASIYTTYYTSSGSPYTYTYTTNYFGLVGFFTDSARLSDSHNVGSCILP